MKKILIGLVIILCSLQAFALTSLEITNLHLVGPTVYMTVQTDEPGIPLADFSATDNGNPVILRADCFNSDSVFVDICFVIDVSHSMEPKIEAVANGIENLVAEIVASRPQTSFRFALITYGATGCPASPVVCPVPGYTDEDVQYYGAPRNYNTSSLWSQTQLVNTLLDLADNTLVGGQEPAYHAILGALYNVPWRTDSERFLVLVSDENNDYAEDPNMSEGGQCSSCGDRPIPQFSISDVVNGLVAYNVVFHTWCNPNVACDLYDRADDVPGGDDLPCQPLQNYGCRTGFADFSPIALDPAIDGCVVLMVEPVQPEQVEELFDCIQVGILTRYQLCFDLGCCTPGVPRNACVTANHNGVASDCQTYTPAIENCQTGGAPTIFCDPTNAAYFTPGDPYTGCFIATGPGGIDYVAIAYQTGICSDVVEATYMGGNRYCITISGPCTNGATVINLDATAYTTCGESAGAECPAIPVQDLTCYDLGDLPNPPYPTFNEPSGGPAHAVGDIVWLGSSVDCEESCCDDGGGEDNGFTPTCDGNPWASCEPLTIVVTVTTGIEYSGQTLHLGIWYDWNGDGDFDDSWNCDGVGNTEWLGDHVVAPGINGVFLGPISNANAGWVNLRMRISTSAFGPADYWGTRTDGEVEDYRFYCPPEQECCELCVVNPPLTIGTAPAPVNPEDVKVVAYVRDGHLRLTWDPVANAAYYKIYRGDQSSDFTTMSEVAVVPGVESEWMETASLNNLAAIRVYQVEPFVQQFQSVLTTNDRGQWEFNEGAGDIAYDNSDGAHHGDLWDPCPPTWGAETIEECDVDFLSFHGVHPNGCPEHVRVPNDDVYYEDRFQIWACIRIWDEPTIDSGPYYIVSNNSFDINGGGFALRLDPGWFWVDGEREYHNRVTAFVWNRDLNGGEGGWMTLQSPPPDPGNPGRYSVPLNRWSTVCVIVNGEESMIIIDGYVVAVGELVYDSDNNGAPLIIGAGYRHSTYEIEYPFYGDIDCIRLTGLEEDGAAAYITVTDPNGGESWTLGSTHSINWASDNVASVQIWYSPDSGGNWYLLTWALPNNGTWSWTIPDWWDVTTHGRIRVMGQNNFTIYDVSDADFSITP